MIQRLMLFGALLLLASCGGVSRVSYSDSSASSSPPDDSTQPAPPLNPLPPGSPMPTPTLRPCNWGVPPMMCCIRMRHSTQTNPQGLMPTPWWTHLLTTHNLPLIPPSSWTITKPRLFLPMLRATGHRFRWCFIKTD